MPVFLFLLGILLTGVGLFLIGFSIPFRDFSLGNTLIVSGATGIVGGIVVFAIAAALRELRKIARLLEAGVPAAAGTVASRSPAPASPAAPAPQPQRAPAAPRPSARPAPASPVPAARPVRAEPRLDSLPSGEDSEPEPPPPAAPTVADITRDRSRGLFASIRGRSQATPQPPRPVPNLGPAAPSSTAFPPVPPVPGPGGPLPDLEEEDAPSPRPAFPERRSTLSPNEPAAEPRPRSPSLAALAARTAARLEVPRQPPEHPAVEQPPPFERSAPEPAPEKPSRNMFDTVWPNDGTETSERGGEAAPPPEPKAPEILKSGVIDGMAYTLYTDGSIEAQLPQGTLRFSSIEDLRAHLERNG